MVFSSHFTRALSALTAGFALIGTPGFAQEDILPETLSIELNTAQTSETGCTLSFFVTNALPGPIDGMVLEAVLFGTEGGVQQLTLFDFGSLPVARPRVRQFIVPGAPCDALGAVLINGAQTCTMGGEPSPSCESGLALRSRIDVDLLG